MNMIGQFPQDNPEQEGVGVIYRLSEGYVLMIRGKTMACPSAHALGQAVIKQLKMLEQEPTPVAVVPKVGEPQPVEYDLNFKATYTEAAHAAPAEPFASGESQALYQRNNLLVSARALGQGEINEEHFELAHKQYFPDVDEATILSVAQSFGWASTRVQHSSDELAGLPTGDEELSPESPDDEEFDPDLPVQVVDLAAGREGRRAARAARAVELERATVKPKRRGKKNSGFHQMELEL